MDEAQKGKIFQLFYSSKGKRGTGIGLFITRKAVLKHGGNITVSSDPNSGTVFTISLPRHTFGDHGDYGDYGDSEDYTEK
jgi:signal transduction histidine kinase